MTDTVADGRLVSLGRMLIRWRLLLTVVAVITAFFGYHAMQLQLLSRFDELLPANHRSSRYTESSQVFGDANTV